MAHSFPKVQEGKRRTILLYLKKRTSQKRWKIGLPPQKVRMECKQSSNNCINFSKIEKQCKKVRDLLIQQLHSSQCETGELRGKVAHSRPQLIETEIDPQAQTPQFIFLTKSCSYLKSPTHVFGFFWMIQVISIHHFLHSTHHSQKGYM